MNPVPDGGPGGAVTGMGLTPLAQVVARLRGAGLDPSRDELADALWLSRWIAPGAPAPASEASGAPTDAEPENSATHDDRPADTPAGEGAGRSTPSATRRDDGERLALHPDPGPPGRGGGPGSGAAALGGAVSVGVPEAAALPARLELQRALRPLQRLRRTGAATSEVLDEQATVDASARAGGTLLPVFRPKPGGDAVLLLLMDASSSMGVWERLLDELRQVFECLGAFREVRVLYLHQALDGSAGVSGRFEASAGALRPPEQLLDPTGRQVTVLVSDCAGPLWRTGAAHRLLYRLQRHTPVAVLQPLPQRLWRRTRLPVSYGFLTRADGPPAPARLRFLDTATPFAEDRPDRGGAVEIPVLPPSAPALNSWARLLSGTGTGVAPGAVGWVRADQPAADGTELRRTELPANRMVARFRSGASSGAYQLAVYLAAAPLFLPVMQLVQRTMLPDSGPAELAEVLLGGLLTRPGPPGSPGPAGPAGPPGPLGSDGPRGTADSRWYEFLPGVREELLGPLARDEALLVLKHCSEYVEQRFGKGGPNFPALAIAQLENGNDNGTATAAVSQDAPNPRDRRDPRDRPGKGAGVRIPEPFAEVAAKVLERFAPLPERPAAGGVPISTDPFAEPPSVAVDRAQALVARFEADGMVQNLLDAVQLLRRAAAAEPVAEADVRLNVALAQNLLRLWQLQGGAALLREAEDAAAAAVADFGTGTARVTLARVLHAAAGERREAADPRSAPELLRRADREFTAGSGAPGLAMTEVLDIALQRARVLEDLWVLEGDPGLLESTVGMLEALIDAWPPSQDRPSGLALAHGRALLKLAGASQDEGRARVHARQAAASLERGRDALERESPRPEERIRAVLDLVDALLLAREQLPRADRLLSGVLRDAPGQLLRAALLSRAARLRICGYREGGPVTGLEATADCFAQACRSVPRDRPEYPELLAEWGAVLLERAGHDDGGPFATQAVRVLRDCRMETPADHPRLPERLLMLGRALTLRYGEEGDLVDLREAEHLFGLAAAGAAGSEANRTRAEAWQELAGTHRLVYRHTHHAGRLDLAAEAYRRAADAAQAAEDQQPEPWEMVELAASAHHWRGVVYEAAQRPRAAREAYRMAQTQWRRLPAGGGAAEALTEERLARLSAA